RRRPRGRDNVMQYVFPTTLQECHAYEVLDWLSHWRRRPPRPQRQTESAHSNQIHHGVLLLCAQLLPPIKLSIRLMSHPQQESSRLPTLSRQELALIAVTMVWGGTFLAVQIALTA